VRIRATLVALLTISALVFGLVSASTVAASKKKGSEGCTPGYWKQEQHFDSYPSGILPSSKFSDVFGSNAFGTKTLLDVLWTGGGGLNALGRHAVAAYLNTASDNVDTVWTNPQSVVNAFKSAVAAGGSAIENTKNIFAAANERGCPLN
jgi:hypothetical protein